MPLKNAIKKLQETVDDLTSLHVQTFTGDLELEITGKEGFENIRAEVQKAKKDGKITLVAETLAQFDGDSYNFVVQDIEKIPELSLEVHKNAVLTGIETRLGLLELFRDMITE